MKKTAIAVLILVLTLGFIHNSSAQEELPFNSATEIVEYMITSPEAWWFKEHYFTFLKKSEIKRLSLATTDPADLTVFKLLCSSRVFVPNNLTDDNLASKARNNGRALKALAAAKIKTIPRGTIQVFTNYPLESIQGLVNHIATPNYKFKALPLGAPTTTWASESYAYVFFQVRTTELVKRSVVLKFAKERGYLEVPTSVDVVFRWSGQQRIPINLGFELWSAKDIPDLELLANNPYYGPMARERLAILLTN